MVRRERQEKLAFARLFVQIAQMAFRVPVEALEPMFKAYAETVIHAVSAQPAKTEKTSKKKETETLLAKLDKLTVSDEPLPPPPEQRRKRGRR